MYCTELRTHLKYSTIYIQASNVTQFPITLFIMKLKYDIKMKRIKYFLCVRDIVSAYLYSLALVHFNDVEVKAVDSFPGTKKDGVQREIVSYVHKNLQKRFFRGIRPDSTHNDNEISRLTVLWTMYAYDAKISNKDPKKTFAWDYKRQQEWNMNALMFTTGLFNNNSPQQRNNN